MFMIMNYRRFLDVLKVWLWWWRQGMPTELWWGNGLGNVHLDDREGDGRTT